MALKRTKLLGIQSITGTASTGGAVGILTVGVTSTAGGVGIASTTYLRGIISHNTGLATATSSIYIYPNNVWSSNVTGTAATAGPVIGVGVTAYRISRVDLRSNETFFFECNYPIVLGNLDKIVVEITQPASTVGGAGIGSVVNYQLLGDTDI